MSYLLSKRYHANRASTQSDIPKKQETNDKKQMTRKQNIMEILGIDIGGSGIKGAMVDVTVGQLTTERHRIETPQPATPEAVTDVVREVVRHFDWRGPIGCAFPAIIKHGTAYSAANIDKSWVGTNAQAMLEDKTGCPVLVVNDADAAGMAEMRFGVAQGHRGIVIILTVGTGIGSAIFNDGVLLPNSELGHLEIRGKKAENRASDRIRKDKDWSWQKWAKKFNEYLNHLEFLFSPDLFVIGGGTSKKFDKFAQHLDLSTEVVPAQLLNEAGIIGAACTAQDLATSFADS